MTDDKKFRILIFFSAALTALVIFYNVFEERIDSDMVQYVQRRMHYESVISKKGLSLHEAKHWKKKE
ncbi:MAG: hypothetical protein EPN22_01830 [Nitrospirae bacterium]|nr:MAG: hypothetical protein EPN22_01830 [Nitrospirota bacterium]